jgi:hypothetical protein
LQSNDNASGKKIRKTRGIRGPSRPHGQKFPAKMEGLGKEVACGINKEGGEAEAVEEGLGLGDDVASGGFFGGEQTRGGG